MHPLARRSLVLLAVLAGLAGAPLGLAQGSAGTLAVGPAETGSRPMPRDPSALSPLGDPFGSGASVRPRLLPVFFPAPIPILGSELPPAPAIRDSIWSELRPYGNELFYAPLGTHFSENDLHRRLRQRLDAYRETREGLLAQLRAALEPSASAGAAAAIAPAQDKALQDLVAQADQLRRDLYRGGLFAMNSDWNGYRNWHLGDTRTKRTPQELLYDEFSVMRAAIYYQEGLSPDQRHLLREIVVEIAETLGDRDVSPLADAFEPDPVLFFLPHGSRVNVPADLPAELSAQIGEFRAAKDALKRELREALFNLDRESDSKRERALQDLAPQQAPRLAALEPLAERIRVALATLPGVRPVAGPVGLPPELAARIDRYLRDKAEVQRAAQQQARNSSDKPAATAESRAALAEFETRNRARLAALATEARAIRDEVARLAASRTEGPKSVDALLADFMGAFKQQQLQSLYAEYRTAVLRPGLSPPQRQLLFDAAVAGLDLTGTKDWQAVPD